MDINDIWQYIQTFASIVLLIISLLIGLKAIYQSIKVNLIQQVVKFIVTAEGEALLTGPEKMNLVISWMKDIIPRLFKVVFDEKVLRMIAQNIFSDMKKYANNYVENKTGASVDKINKIIIVAQEVPELEKKVEEIKKTQAE